MASRIGVDIGGTFTDFIFYDEEAKSVTIDKIPKTAKNNPKTWNLFVFSILNMKHNKIIIAGIAVLKSEALITWVWIKARYVNELNKPTLVKAKKNNKGKLLKITFLYFKISL